MTIDQKRKLLRALIRDGYDATATRQIAALRNDTFPDAQSLIDDDADRIAVGLARRGAKTNTVLRKVLRVLLRKPNLKWPWVADKQKNAKRIVDEPLMEMDRRYGLGLRVNQSEMSYTLPNGSRIQLYGLNDAGQVNDLRGSKYPGVTVDETQSIRTDLEQFIQSVVIPALMDFRGTLILAGTPDPKRVVQLWHRAITGKDARWSRHWWPLQANTFLNDPAGWLHKMLTDEGYTENDPRFRAEFLGDVNAVDATNIMFQDYLHSRNWTAEIPAHKWRWFCGWDIGLSDKAAWCVWAYSFVNRRVYLVHTFHRSGMDISEQAGVMLALMERYPSMTVVGDEGALGKLIALEVTNRFPEITMEPAEKSDKALQVALMNTDFRTGRAMLAGTDHVMDPETKLPAIRAQWEATIWDENHQREQEGQEVDLMDAGIYGWRACKTYRDLMVPAVPVDTWERDITDYDSGRKVQHFERKP